MISLSLKKRFSPSISNLILLNLVYLIFSPIAVNANPTVKISQLFYPPANNPSTFMVVGKGEATQKADVAVLGLSLASSLPLQDDTNVLFQPVQQTSSSESETAVKNIVDALLSIGLSKSDIQVQYPQGSSSNFSLPLPLPIPFPTQNGNDQIKILVTIQNPNHERLQQIIKVATNASNNTQSLGISTVDVRYRVSDCQKLLDKVYESAVKNAQSKANAIASALGANLNPIPSVAEPFYQVFFPEGCAANEGSLFGNSAVSYDPNAPIQVQMSKEIFVTYSVR